MCLRRDFPFLFKVPDRVLGVCLGTGSVYLKRLHSLASEWPRCPSAEASQVSLPTGTEGGTMGPGLGSCRRQTDGQIDRLHYTKLPSWCPVLVIVAGELHFCPKFHSDVWNRSEGRFEVPGKLLWMGQVLHLTYSCFLSHFLFMWPVVRLSEALKAEVQPQRRGQLTGKATLTSEL